MTAAPIRPADDAARALARRLIDTARFGALAVTDPETGAPTVSRIAIATDGDGRPVSLVSDLSAHTAALRSNPRCALLLGEPGAKGDPLTHPRITLDCTARFPERDSAEAAALRARYLAARPKARLYAGFADFSFVLFEPASARLNGGFGKAFRLDRADLVSRAT